MLALLVPGLGHLYAGRRHRAFAVVALTLLALFLLQLALTAGAVISLAIAGIGFSIAIAVDAGRCGYRAQPLPGSRRRRVALYVVFVVSSLGAFELVRAGTREYWVAPFRMPANAMAPTLLAGDYFMLDKRAFSHSSPRAGDVVVVSSPTASDQQFVKRVVAGPQDVVLFHDGRIFVNGKELPGPRSKIAFDRTTLGPDTYFVVNDHRAHSRDSREWGAVGVDAIQGRVFLIHFSMDPESYEIRWERIGKTVD
jgi:signal peptidase I